MIDLAAIRSEIEAGLPLERDRLEASFHNVNFYRGEFDAYWGPEPPGVGPPRRRPSLIMQWTCNTLGALYATGPARELADDQAATDWLADLYAREGVDGLLQEADRLAIAADVAAVQVVATGDAARPIRFALWPAHQFVAWESEDDPTAPAAVATIDYFDARRRLRLYTPGHELTFRTGKAGGTAGGTAYEYVDTVPNPFGVVPFAFVHANPPTTQFWSHGPGDALRAVNEYLNRALTDVGESIRFGLDPVVKTFGCGTWKPPSPRRPGDVWDMPAGAFDEAGNGIPATADYLQADPGFVEAEWSDLQGYVDHALQTVNVPPAAFRMTQDAAASGVALVAEQLPVLRAIEARQRPFLAYERQLARVALAVGGLDPAAADGLRLRWPEVVPRSLLFGADEDKADRADLDLGITSRVQILMRRFNWTRDQAIAHLKQVAEDREEEAAIGAPPVAQQATNQAAPGGQESDDGGAEGVQGRPGPDQGAGGAGGRPGAEG